MCLRGMPVCVTGNIVKQVLYNILTNIVSYGTNEVLEVWHKKNDCSNMHQFASENQT